MDRTIACVVPARLGSTRFPGKLLHQLLGKPMVVHTLERAQEADCFSEILCFTDSEAIGKAVSDYGFKYVLTGEAHNGTDRIGRHLDSVATHSVVNLQGDEPAFPPAGLRTLCSALQTNPNWVHTLVHEGFPSPQEQADPNRVKVKLDAEGFVTYFFRTLSSEEFEDLQSHKPSPGDFNLQVKVQVKIQIGAYGYGKDFLRRYVSLPISDREKSLSHELLRDTSLAPIRAHASTPGASVDVPADLEHALDRLRVLQVREGKIY